MKNAHSEKGFTLIEVMVALVVLAIGLGALFVASSQNIRAYQHLQERVIANWISIQATNQVHLGLITPSLSVPYTSSTTILGIKTYWKVELQPTRSEGTYLATISSKMHPSGPWQSRSYTYSSRR